MFKFFTRLRIRTKLLVVTLGLIFTVLPFIFVYLYMQMDKVYYESVSEAVANSVTNAANEISKEIDSHAAVVRTLANAFAADVANGGHDDDLRSRFNGMIQFVLESNPSMSALWTVWEPNALDGLDAEFAGTEGHDQTGRFVPHWVRTSEGLRYIVGQGYETGDFYVRARQTNAETITEPFMYADGRLYVAITCPIIVRGKFVGAVGTGVTLGDIQKIVDQQEVLGTNMAAVYTENDNIVAHYNPDHIGKKVRGTIDLYSAAQVSDILTGIKARVVLLA